MASATTSTETRERAQFRYVARNGDGQKVRGEVQARSPRGARVQVMEQGLDPIRVRQRSGVNVQLTAKKVRPVELMHFSRQLSAFVRAGVPILDALDGLAEGMDNSTFERAVLDLTDALQEGHSLTSAMEEHPKVFPAFFYTAIQAAERTGNLDVTLDRLADYLERDVENRRKVKEALAYPSIVMFMAAVVVIVLSVFVMPRFEGFFAALGSELPLATRILVGVMDFLATWWWALLAGFVLLGILLKLFTRTPRGRRWRDATVLKIPLIGTLVSTAIIERFARALGSMIDAAVPIPEAMEIAGEGTQNTRFMSRVAEARTRMMRGDGITGPLADTRLFPAAAIQMVSAGEQTGTLGQQLMTTANYFEKELDYRLRRFTTFFEPAVIIAAGLVVGFVAVALVSAMYGMVTGLAT